MRAWLMAAALVLMALPPGSAGEELLQWETWVADDTGDGVAAGIAPSPIDVRTLEVAADGEYLHLRLTTDVPVPASERILLEAYVSGEGAGGGNFYVESVGDRLVFHHAGREIPERDYGFSADSTPGNFHGWVRFEQVIGGTSDTIHLQTVDVEYRHTLGADDAAGGEMYLYRNGLAGYAASHVPLAGTWVEEEGPDFGGGPSVAVGADGIPRVAYFIYNAERGTDVGLWLATVGKTWAAERIADFTPVDDLHEDDRTRTRIALDGATAHVLYAPCPDQGCPARVRLVSGNGDDGWTQTTAPASLKAGNTHRDVHALAAHGGRVVAALMTTEGDVAVVDIDGTTWKVLHTVRDARLPRLAFDSDGDLHLSWMRPTETQGPSEGTDVGDLWYARASAGWDEARIVAGVEDRSGFWEGSETDGSYAMALNAQGTPCFVYELRYSPSGDPPERGYGCLAGTAFDPEPTPITPGHGNIQLTMRMAFDAAGNAHIGSGYGGTDLYAVRTPDGAWGMQDVRRHDAWDMAVTPGGVPVFAYTQPHGGTTVAASAMPGGMPTASDAGNTSGQTKDPADANANAAPPVWYAADDPRLEGADRDAPGPAALAVLAAVGAALALLRRR